MIRVGLAYGLLGLLFFGVAVIEARRREDPRRFWKAGFFALLAVSFLGGDLIGDLANGALLLGLAVIAGLGRLQRRPHAAVAGSSPPAAAATLIGAALVIPAVTLLGSIVIAKLVIFGRPLFDPQQATPIALAFGVLAALGVAALALRPRPREPIEEAARLFDAVGWAAILPQALAALGAVFALAGVGTAVGEVAGRWLPLGDRLGAVCAYTVGMALLTVLMGNAFAAFPVMTSAIGAPILIRAFGGDPAVVGAVGMLSGFCGTLVTPMAANFNIVPVALLELSDRYAVIKAQAPTAAALLLVNTLLLYLTAFGGPHGA